MRCLWCFSSHITKGLFACSINPVIGNEVENKWAIQPAVKKKVLIAGGGIGGIQAAITAAQRGHDVTLCEKTDKLGGVLNCEHNVSFKKPLTEYLARQARALKAAGVDIEMNTEVTPGYVEKASPDVLIVSLGSKAVKPALPGIDGSNVFSAEEIYLSPDKAGQNVVILGGGLVGAELAIHLTQLGRAVSVVEMAPALGDGGNTLHGLAIRLELARKKVAVNLSVTAIEITGKGLVGESADGKKLFEADTIIYAAGQAPRRDEAESLRFTAPEFHQIGDCVTPKNIAEATRLAYYVTRNLGRF